MPVERARLRRQSFLWVGIKAVSVPTPHNPADLTYVISAELVPEVYTRTVNHLSAQARAREKRTLRDVRDLVWLVAVGGHVLDHADVRGQRGLQDVHLQTHALYN